MKKILLAALIVASANAKWESAHLRNGDLVLFNTETGQIYKEFKEGMIPVGFSEGTQLMKSESGDISVELVSPMDLRPKSYPIKK